VLRECYSRKELTEGFFFVRCSDGIEGGRVVNFRVRGSRVGRMVKSPYPIWLRSNSVCCGHFADETRMFVRFFLCVDAMEVDPRNHGR
jgi:hypothetical protein